MLNQRFRQKTSTIIRCRFPVSIQHEVLSVALRDRRPAQLVPFLERKLHGVGVSPDLLGTVHTRLWVFRPRLAAQFTERHDVKLTFPLPSRLDNKTQKHTRDSLRRERRLPFDDIRWIHEVNKKTKWDERTLPLTFAKPTVVRRVTINNSNVVRPTEVLNGKRPKVMRHAGIFQRSARTFLDRSNCPFNDTISRWPRRGRRSVSPAKHLCC